jgi:hypothetical protein
MYQEERSEEARIINLGDTEDPENRKEEALNC